MNIQVATLCDSAHDYQGKLCILGTFDTIGARGTPIVHQNAILALRVVFRTEDEGRHTLTIRMRDMDFQDIMPALPPLEFGVQLPPEVDFLARNMIMHFERLQFPKPGVYSMDIQVDGNELTSIPIRVVLVEPRQA